MKNDDVKVLFYLKKNEESADGKCPVITRLTVGKSSTTFSAKIDAPLSLWESGRVKGKSREAVSINRKLDEFRASAMSHYRELSAVKEVVTAEEIKNLLLGMASGQTTLLAYFREHNEKFRKRVGVSRKKSSAKGYDHALSHVSIFLKKKYNLSDISFAALDRSFIDKFDLYLKIDCGLAPGTIVLLTTRLGTIVGNAIVEGIITRNPFAGYEPPRPRPIQKYLTGVELEKLITSPLSKARHYLIRDLFLFSCYTGIPYADMRKLSGDDLWSAPDGILWIKTCREKTGMDYELPLLDLPLHILDLYRDTAPAGRLLPMYHISELNRELKHIAQTCGIDRRLTFHMARHTYASEITLSQGVPIETVSRMLGHNQIKTTQIYAKVTNDKIDEDMSALGKRLADQFSFAI